MARMYSCEIDGVIYRIYNRIPFTRYFLCKTFKKGDLLQLCIKEFNQKGYYYRLL